MPVATNTHRVVTSPQLKSYAWSTARTPWPVSDMLTPLMLTSAASG